MDTRIYTFIAADGEETKKLIKLLKFYGIKYDKSRRKFRVGLGLVKVRVVSFVCCTDEWDKIVELMNGTVLC